MCDSLFAQYNIYIYIYTSNLYDTYRILYIHYILLLYSSTVYARVSAQ